VRNVIVDLIQWRLISDAHTAENESVKKPQQRNLPKQ